MKKGFMHVIEIVVISLLVIVIISQLYRNVPAQSEWDKTQLKILAGDILHALDAREVSWTTSNGDNARAEIINILENTTILFDLYIENLPKPDLSVGCICSDDDFSDLKQMVAFGQNKVNFVLNQMDYEIRFTKIYDSDVFPESLDFPMIYDVIIICDLDQSLEASSDRMKSYLQSGRGIILIKDIGHGDYTLDTDVFSDIFGLEEVGGTLITSGYLNFKNNSDSQFYNIRKYFLAIQNDTATVGLDDFINESFRFPNFLDAGEALLVSGADWEEENEILMTTTGSPKTSALIVNDKVYIDNGRTAWLSDGIGTNEIEEKGVLIKALILWASGEKFIIEDNFIRHPETSYLIDSINRIQKKTLDMSLGEKILQQTTFFHPIKVMLSLGYALK